MSKRYYHCRKFKERLKNLGFQSYKDYLKSEHWKKINKKYKKSRFPQHCIVCSNKRFQLHHRSYARIGNEYLTDFIPLCQKCHQEIHNYLNENLSKTVNATHRIIRIVFNLSNREIRKRMRFWLQYPHKK